VPRNRPAIDEVREVWRRSGGTTPRLGQAELAAWYAAQLADVRDLHGFRSAALRFDPEAFVPAAERARWLALPGAVEIRDRTVPIHYDVEEQGGTSTAVVRLQMPEKLARTLVAEELPELDRPLRFVVTRGARGSVRASSLEEMQALLDEPWSSEERERPRGRRGDDRGGRGPGGYGGRDRGGRGRGGKRGRR
jgi:hypothetical protein